MPRITANHYTHARADQSAHRAAAWEIASPPDLDFASRFTDGGSNPALHYAFGTSIVGGGTRSGAASLNPDIGSIPLSPKSGSGGDQPSFDTNTMTVAANGLTIDGIWPSGEPTDLSEVIGFRVKVNTAYEALAGTGLKTALLGHQIGQSPAGLTVRQNGNPTQAGVVVSLPEGFTDGDFMFLGCAYEDGWMHIQPSDGPRVSIARTRTINGSGRYYLGAYNDWTSTPYAAGTPSFHSLSLWPGEVLSEDDMRQFMEDAYLRAASIGLVCE